MDPRNKIAHLILALLITLIFTSQNSPKLYCFIIRNENAALILKLSENLEEPLVKNSLPISVQLIKDQDATSLKFLKSTVQEKDFFNYFSTGYFIIPPHSKIEFSDKSVLTIKEGKYSITESGLYYELELK